MNVRANIYGGIFSFVALILVSLAGSTRASATELEDLVGEWTLAVQLPGIPGPPQLATLLIEDTGDGLIGQLSSQLGEQDIEDITLEGEEFKLIFPIEMGGQAMVVTVTATLEGKNKGAGSVVIGEGVMQLEFKSARVGTDEETALKAEVEAAASAGTESQGEPTLSASDAAGFIEEWVLSLETQQGSSDVVFNVIDVDGMAVAKLELPPPLGSQTVNDLAINDAGELVAKFSMNMGDMEFNLSMTTALNDGKLTGKIGDEAGFLTMEFKGITKKESLANAETITDEERSRRRRNRGRGGRGRTELTLGGKTIWIVYGQPKTSGAGYQAMEQHVSEGFVWRMGSDQATKLKTEADLKFGDTTIAAGPYSLWARRIGDGWNLVFNHKADVWGTQHRPEADVAEVPFKWSKTDENVEVLTIELDEDGDGGLLRLAWGDAQGVARFTLAE